MTYRTASKVINRHFYGASYRKSTLNKAHLKDIRHLRKEIAMSKSIKIIIDPCTQLPRLERKFYE